MFIFIFYFVIFFNYANLNEIATNSSQGSRGQPVLSFQHPISRILGPSGSVPPTVRIQHESYKALAGETVRLECPQPNPTWFFRRTSRDTSGDDGSVGSVEDLIVTRHGIINADYKYKIMCHVTLKHKVIVINSIDFEDEGLYTCLYTMPVEANRAALGKSFASLNSELTSLLISGGSGGDSNPIQYRHVFNVSVYTLISGLTMNFMLIPSKLPTNTLTQSAAYKKYSTDQFSELIENSITVRENDEFLISCVVDNSKPVADVRFSLLHQINNSERNHQEILSLNHNNHISSYLTLSPHTSSTPAPFEAYPNQDPSILSINTNVMKNNDQTFKTILTAKIRPSQEDHGKVIACKAENGFSNQKWENKKLLNVLFPPVCKDPPRFTYYVGINQTLNVECRVQNANPIQVTYEWNLENIMSSSSSSLSSSLYDSISPSGLLKNVVLDDAEMTESSFVSIESGGKMQSPPGAYSLRHQPPSVGYVEPSSVSSKMSGMVSEGLSSRFKWRPTNMNDFGEIKCRVTNEIGTSECLYEIRLGGVPNPPTNCVHTLKNTSAIISCQVGFHQGDPDIYCYLLRKSENGVYKEHTRNRESCSFIVNDVNADRLNEFWIYSSNKHGHNKDNGVYLTIGQIAKAIGKSNDKNYVIVGIVVAILVFSVIACCFCYKIRKGSDDSDSIFENSDSTYPTKNLNGNGMRKSSQDYSVKTIKGVKADDSPTNITDLKDQNYIKLEMNKSYMEKEKQYQFYNGNHHQNLKEYDKNIESLKQGSSNNYTSLKNEGSYFYSGPDAKTTSVKKYSLFKASSSNSNNTSSVYDNSEPPQASSDGLTKKSNSFSKNLSRDENDSFTGSSGSNSISSSSNVEEKNKLIKSGLLTTVDKVKSLNDSNLQLHNKMVTFSSMHSYSNLSQASPIKSSINNPKRFVLNNHKPNQQQQPQSDLNARAFDSNQSQANPSITTTTTSASASSTSPTVSSLDSPPLDDTASMSQYNEMTTLTVSDQSYSTATAQQQQQQQVSRPSLTMLNRATGSKLTTFSILNPVKVLKKSAPNQPKAANSAEALSSSVLYSNGIQHEFTDNFETRYLNKLCEDVEVSLNVDCECADDYSSNDFSGDYSFDNNNDFKPYSIIPVAKANLSKKLVQPTTANIAIKKGVCGGNRSIPNSNSDPSTASNDRESTSNKSQLGVLV